MGAWEDEGVWHGACCMWHVMGARCCVSPLPARLCTVTAHALPAVLCPSLLLPCACAGRMCYNKTHYRAVPPGTGTGTGTGGSDPVDPVTRWPNLGKPPPP